MCVLTLKLRAYLLYECPNLEHFYFLIGDVSFEIRVCIVSEHHLYCLHYSQGLEGIRGVGLTLKTMKQGEAASLTIQPECEL